jgi:hypothetical protein
MANTPDWPGILSQLREVSSADPQQADSCGWPAPAGGCRAHHACMTHSELLPIPPLESATDPVYSPADLRQRWRALMGPLGFGQRLLWVGFLGCDRRLYKTMTQIPMPPFPRRDYIDDVLVRLRWILYEFEPGTTPALLMTRPGVGGVSDLDRQWAALLTEVAAERDLRLEAIFRANDDCLVQVETPVRVDSGTPANQAPASLRECPTPSSVRADRPGRPLS